MRNGPTVAEVQQAIDLSWEHENSYNENRNVLPYASSFVAPKASLSNTKPLVKHTYVVGHIDGDLAAYAIVQLNGGMSTYDVAGWQVMLLTQDAGLARTLDKTQVGDKTWEDEAIVSIDGKPVVTYQEALELRQAQKQARQLAIEMERVTTKIRQREIRLQQDKRNFTKFHQLECFKDVLNNELQLQEGLLLELKKECKSLEQVQKLEQDVLDANISEKASFRPMRRKAALLREMEQEQEIARMKIRDEQKLQEAQNLQRELQREQELQEAQCLKREQELQEAQRLQQEQISKQEKAARQKDIDKEVAQFDRSTGLLAYEEATNQIEAIKHYTQEGASHYIIRERAAYLRSQCIKSRDAVPYASAQATASDGERTRIGAIIGGMFGVIGGPVGIAFGAVAGGFIGNIADAISQPSPERNRWTRLIDGIDELVSKLPE